MSRRNLENAELAFWESVRKSYPEASEGGRSPLVAKHLTATMKEAISIWLRNNTTEAK